MPEDDCNCFTLSLGHRAEEFVPILKGHFYADIHVDIQIDLFVLCKTTRMKQVARGYFNDNYKGFASLSTPCRQRPLAQRVSQSDHNVFPKASQYGVRMVEEEG